MSWLALSLILASSDAVRPIVGQSHVASLLSLSITRQSLAWRGAYERGLSLAKAGEWSKAREEFLVAIKSRPNDSANPTPIPGPITERRTWRNGAAYSANLLAAYSGFRAASGLADAEAKSALLRLVASELEALQSRQQLGPNGFFLLGETYGALGETQKRNDLSLQGINRAWREDTEIIAPEQLAVTGGDPTSPPITTPANLPPNPGTVPPPATPLPGNPVPTFSASGAPVPLASKFALVIGTSQTSITDLAVPFAATDAELVKNELIASGGYPTENVELLQNPTAEQIRTMATLLAGRVTARGTVLIYFTGPGTNISGRDYFIGPDTADLNDTARMVSKLEIVNLFLNKEARVFLFLQSNRRSRNGQIFGNDYPNIGPVGQMSATPPDGMISYMVREGRQVGLFTDAVVNSFRNFRSNQIPLDAFSYFVRDYMLRGNTGTTGGGSRQIATLPVLVGLANDARL